MGGAVVSRLIVLVGGTLFPAYSSYKAIKSANVRQYVRWMMYWIVYALFITVETFTDMLLSWAPFYYEIKVGFIIWLISPYTKGAAFLYRKFIHPYLSEKEPEIDNFLTSAKEKSYATVVNYGSRGINVATSAFVTAAVKGQSAMSEKLKSFSVNDLSRLSDDTPIHSMSPLSSYNPPVQREIHRRSPFEGSSREPPTHTERQASQETEVDMDTFEVIGADAAPSGGLVMSRAPSGDSYGREGKMHIETQYKAYSMMNLSAPEEQEQTIMTRTIEFTSAPPETSVDDSVIPDETVSFQRGEPAYSTLPRQRKSKKSGKKEESDSSSLRRSKRRSKPQNYDDSDDEQYHS